jgi:DNA-binding response OmpR family regulator
LFFEHDSLTKMTSLSDPRALVVTLDPWLGKTFDEVSKELGIEAQTSSNTGGVPEELGRERFEALLIDFDTVSDTTPILVTLRGSPSNKSAIVLAVATGAERKQQAINLGVNFVFERPLEMKDLRLALTTAYDLMVRERRAYFRCPIELRVQLTRSNSVEIQCTTFNISSRGMAVHSPTPFNLAESLEIALDLPGGETVLAQGAVVWDDRHGKAGIHFTCNPEMQQLLDSWLDLRFAHSLS